MSLRPGWKFSLNPPFELSVTIDYSSPIDRNWIGEIRSEKSRHFPYLYDEVLTTLLI